MKTLTPWIITGLHRDHSVPPCIRENEPGSARRPDEAPDARFAPRIRRPVLAYGVLELGIALWALALPTAIRAVSTLYLGWLGGLDALPETLGIATHAFHLAGAFAVLVPCTALMGATL